MPAADPPKLRAKHLILECEPTAAAIRLGAELVKGVVLFYMPTLGCQKMLHPFTNPSQTGRHCGPSNVFATAAHYLVLAFAAGSMEIRQQVLRRPSHLRRAHALSKLACSPSNYGRIQLCKYPRLISFPSPRLTTSARVPRGRHLPENGLCLTRTPFLPLPSVENLLSAFAQL